jgi:transposase
MSQQALQVGIDFSHKKADFCVLAPNGQVIDRHQAFSNSYSGFSQAKEYLLHHLSQGAYEGIEVSAEATNNYWLPFFLQLSEDPQLQSHDIQLFLENPKRVHWFKRSLAEDNKTDRDDPYYIAERTRSRHRKYAWRPQKEWRVLRFLTRLRFHLGKAITREKNYFLNYLFLQHSAYNSVKPFANTFGQTSLSVLSRRHLMKELSRLPKDKCIQRLREICPKRLPDPAKNAHRIVQVVDQSFPVEENMEIALQQGLDLVQQRIQQLESQCQLVEEWIASEVTQNHPEVLFLAEIDGIGLYFAAGIAAEIGDLERFFEGEKWDRRKKRNRKKNLKDVEDAIAKYAGLWWPQNSSGDFEAEQRYLSKQGNRYLRYYLVEGANFMRQYVPDYSHFYAKKYTEALKHKHKRALVLTARKSVGLFVGLLHRKEPYRSKEVTKPNP